MKEDVHHHPEVKMRDSAFWDEQKDKFDFKASKIRPPGAYANINTTGHSHGIPAVTYTSHTHQPSQVFHAHTLMEGTSGKTG